MFLAIEGNKLCSFRLGSYNNLMTKHHIGIEAMHRLTVCHHHIIGNVHDIVYRAQTDGCQLVLQPIRTLLNLTVGYTHTSIAFASLLILDYHLYRQFVVVNGKCRAVRTMQRCLIAVLLQPCIKVACHSPMRQRIGSVGCDINLYQPVAFKIIVFCCRCSYYCIFWQNDNAVVAYAHSNLVFSTNHSARLNAAQF